MTNLRLELERFYEDNEQQLFTFALSMTRDHDGAEDAVHEAFSRLLQMGGCPDNLKSYVFRSVRNAAIDGMRKTARLCELTDEGA
ncbi:MAG TPA: sigma-70 family RNA polymerase sigma factor, partial [bacterium]|nr:sigma-70 family RNA polymerase sigma factor [bacterium]